MLTHLCRPIIFVRRKHCESGKILVLGAKYWLSTSWWSDEGSSEGTMTQLEGNPKNPDNLLNLLYCPRLAGWLLGEHCISWMPAAQQYSTGFGKNPQSSEWLVGPYVHAREGLLWAIVSPHLPFKCQQMASLQYHRVPSCVCVIVWGIYCSVMLGKGCVHMCSTPSRNVASVSPPSIECASPYTWMIITQRYRTKSKQPS